MVCYWRVVTVLFNIFLILLIFLILILEKFKSEDIFRFVVIRKLIKQGHQGLTVTLPIKWVRKYNLKGGGEINLEETDQGLLFSTKGNIKNKELNLFVDETNKSRIRTIISSAYRRGFNKVTLKTKNKFSFLEINQIVDSLIGFVITEQYEQKIVIENVMKDQFEHVESILNKLFVTTKYLQSKVISGEKNDAEIIQLKMSILKLRDYAQRMIHLNNYGGDKSYEFHSLVLLTEKFSSGFVKLYNSGKIKDKSSIEIIIKQFSELITIFNKKDIQKAIKLNDYISKLKHKNLTRKVDGPIFIITEYLFGISSRIVGILV